MQWTFADAPGHLLVTVEGEWVLASILTLFNEIGSECRSRGYDRVLIDCRDLGGPVSEAEKFVVGSRVAERLGPIFVAAVLASGLRITGFAGDVAARRGGNLLVTADMSEALRYLSSVH